MSRKHHPMFQIALTANLFEWYEVSLTGLMALEIGRLFFPVSGDKTALMLSFAVFAASYLARPIGSVFFGLWGNKFGAGVALKLSMTAMAIPAILIAFLPTYPRMGYLATCLLIALKLRQGFATGGEMPLSAYYVSLNAPDKHRGLYCGLVSCSSHLGMLLASFVVFILPYCATLMSRIFPHRSAIEPFVASWRWPFLLCIPLSLWIFSIRSPIAYLTTKGTPSIWRWHKQPIAPLLNAAALVAFTTLQLYALFLWLPSYLHAYVGVSLYGARLTHVIALSFFSICVAFLGYATRWISAPKLVFVGIGTLVLFSYPLFVILQNGDFVSLLLVQLAFALMAGCLLGGIYIVLPDLFKDNWQSLGMTVCFTLPVAIFGGTAPLVCGYLIGATHLLTAPALYIVAMGLIALPVAYRLAFTGNNLSSTNVDGSLKNS